MKRSDLLFAAVLAAIFLPFIFSVRMFELFVSFSKEWAFTASFIKFAILATMGEMLGSRIKKGLYLPGGFALPARAFVWGILGVTVKAAFMIFSGGAPAIVEYLGMKDTHAVLSGPLSGGKVLLAFTISIFLNIFYAPVLMITHRVTDTHIALSGGDPARLFGWPDAGAILKNTDWQSLWGFVLKKTIPFFWIPAQTVTFLLPPEFQILFAALLSTVLGVILATSSATKSK